MTLPSDYNVQVLSAPRTIVPARRIMRPLDVGQVLVQILAVGICGSDLSTYRGNHPYKTAPAVLGHEFCGRIVALGERPGDLAVGDLVCGLSYAPCGRCKSCIDGRLNLCARKETMSVGSWDGAFAEYIVGRSRALLRLPEIAPEIGALVEPLSIAAHAFSLLREPPRHVAILGAGNIGACCLVVARARSADQVIVIDAAPTALQRARELGADATRLAGPGWATGLENAFDCVIVVSGHDTALKEAATLVSPGGFIVLLAYFDAATEMVPNDLIRQEAAVLTSYLSTPADMEAVVGDLLSGRIAPTGLLGRQVPLDMASDVLRALDNGKEGPGKVILLPDGSGPR